MSPFDTRSHFLLTLLPVLSYWIHCQNPRTPSPTLAPLKTMASQIIVRALEDCGLPQALVRVLTSPAHYGRETKRILKEGTLFGECADHVAPCRSSIVPDGLVLETCIDLSDSPRWQVRKLVKGSYPGVLKTLRASTGASASDFWRRGAIRHSCKRRSGRLRSIALTLYQFE